MFMLQIQVVGIWGHFGLPHHVYACHRVHKTFGFIDIGFQGRIRSLGRYIFCINWDDFFT